MNRSETFSLRQVVELTGLSEFTLRGWENRYSAFEPGRSGTGRRRYSEADVQRAMLLRELLTLDYRIGEIAQLPTAKLRELRAHAGGETEAPSPAAESSPVSEVFRALAVHDWGTLEALIAEAFREPPREVISQFVLPVLARLGLQVAAGSVSVAQEHVISALLKEGLYSLRPKRKARREERLLIATPEGDYHELGVLLCRVLAELAGWKVLFLGPNTPRADLCETALRYRATHVLLGATVARKEGAKEELLSYLSHLDRHLPKGTALWLGGPQGGEFRGSFARPWQRFLSIEEFETAVFGEKKARSGR